MGKGRINEIIKNKVVQNTGWMVFERIFQMGISLIVGVISARYLGPSNYGILNYAASFVLFFSSLCSLGLEGIIVKEIVNNPQKEGEIIGSGILMRLISSLISMGAICLIISLLNPNDEVMLVVAFLQSIAIIFRSFELFEFWYQAKLQSKVSAGIKSFAYIVMASYKIMLLYFGKSVEWFAFSTAVDVGLIAFLYLVFYKKHGGQRMSFSFGMAKTLISQSYYFIFSGIFVVIYSQMDKVFIGYYLNEEQVGFYSAALTIATMWTFIPQALTNSFRPILFDLKKTDEAKYLRRLKQLYALIFWLGMTFCLVISVASRWIVIVLFGDAYAASRNALLISVWSTIFALLGSARGIWLISENKNKYVIKILLWGAILSLGLNVILIPVLGIEGSAIASLCTQVLTGIIAPLFYKETRIHTKYLIDAIMLKGIK